MTEHRRVAGRRLVAALPAPRRVAVQRPAAQGSVLGRAAFVVAQARLVVGEEHLADQVAAAAHPDLVEHALQVLLHGVRRNHQPLGDLGGGVALQHQAGDVLAAGIRRRPGPE